MPSQLPHRISPRPLPQLRVAVGAVALTLCASTTQALEWRANAGAGILTTDNLFRTTDNQTKADIVDTNVGFLARESTRTLDLDVDGSMVFRRYNIDSVGDDKLPNLRGHLQWTLSPDRFAWVLNENLGQIAINPTDALVPPDRQNLNIISTGPDARLAVGNASWFTASGRYSNVNYQSSPFDNDKFGGRIGYEHELDSGRFISMNALSTHTQYKDVGTNFNIQTLFAGYVSTGTHASIDANLGVERLKQGSLTKNGYFADITLDRRITRRSEIFINLSHRLGDSASLFTRSQSLEPDVNQTTDVIASDQSVEQTAIDMTYGWTGRRTQLSAGVLYFDDKYSDEFSSANRSGLGTTVAASIQIRPRLKLSASADWRRSAPETGTAQIDSQARLGLLWQFSRLFDLNLGAERFRRSGSIQGFNETRLLAMVEWRVTHINGPHMRPAIDTPASRRINSGRQ